MTKLDHPTDELDAIEVQLSRVAVAGGAPSREQLLLTQRRKDLLASSAVREIPKFLPARTKVAGWSAAGDIVA